MTINPFLQKRQREVPPIEELNEVKTFAIYRTTSKKETAHIYDPDGERMTICGRIINKYFHRGQMSSMVMTPPICMNCRKGWSRHLARRHY